MNSTDAILQQFGILSNHAFREPDLHDLQLNLDTSSSYVIPDSSTISLWHVALLLITTSIGYCIGRWRLELAVLFHLCILYRRNFRNSNIVIDLETGEPDTTVGQQCELQPLDRCHSLSISDNSIGSIDSQRFYDCMSSPMTTMQDSV